MEQKQGSISQRCHSQESLEGSLVPSPSPGTAPLSASSSVATSVPSLPMPVLVPTVVITSTGSIGNMAGFASADADADANADANANASAGAGAGHGTRIDGGSSTGEEAATTTAAAAFFVSISEPRDFMQGRSSSPVSTKPLRTHLLGSKIEKKPVPSHNHSNSHPNNLQQSLLLSSSISLTTATSPSNQHQTASLSTLNLPSSPRSQSQYIPSPTTTLWPSASPTAPTHHQSDYKDHTTRPNLPETSTSTASTIPTSSGLTSNATAPSSFASSRFPRLSLPSPAANRSSRLSVFNLRQFLHLDGLNLRPPFLRKNEPKTSLSAGSLSSPSSPALSTDSTSSTTTLPSSSSSPSPPQLVSLLSATDLTRVTLSAQKIPQSAWPESPDFSLLDSSTDFSSPVVHKKQEPQSLIDVACTTPLATDLRHAAGFSSDLNTVITSTSAPPAPSHPPPAMPISTMPLQQVPRYQIPSGKPHSLVRTNSSTSLSVDRTPPRQISPARSQTQSTISSVSSDKKRTPAHAATFPRTNSPSLKIVPSNEDTNHDVLRGRNASGHNVLMKHAPSRDGSMVRATPPPPPQTMTNGNLLDPEALKPQALSKTSRRMSFFGGLRSRASSVAPPMPGPADMTAWIMAKEGLQEYNLQYLVHGEMVPELWNDSGNVLVHLLPREQSRGPSFKVPATVITSSEVLREHLVEASQGGRSRGRSFGGRSLTASDAAMMTMPLMLDNVTEYALYIPESLPSQTPQTAVTVSHRFVGIRNLFSMLTGQPLVGTHAYPTPTAALFQIADLLQEFGYRSLSGESFGEEVNVAFGFYMKSMDLSDIRNSRVKTIEALLLGEKMRSRELYDDAFAHCVGKYSAILDMRSPLYNQLSQNTRDALDRAHLDLMKRLDSINDKLEGFNFPSVFTGIANSTSLEEFHGVDFKTWRMSFARMRTLVMNHYKHKFGNWPPKASSKKNSFTESGLNRMVLGTLYRDMCAIYDLIADRKALTGRVIDGGWSDNASEDEPVRKALRRLLAEYDTSNLPVIPPIPYDVPTMPMFASVSEGFESKPRKEKILFHKRVKENELTLVLEKSYDFSTPNNYPDCTLLQEFKNMELKEAKGKSEAEMGAQRIGYWIFMYCVIQMLPWVVLDAPTVKYSGDVEYFLCQPATGNAPWILDQPQVRKQWYVTAEGHTVELSADAVMHSPEAVYRRSHCWKMAEQWEQDALQQADAAAGSTPKEITPPGSVCNGSAAPSPVLRPRSNLGSPRVPSMHRSSIAIGLEPISLNDLPPDIALRANRSSVAVNSLPYRQSMHVRSRSVGPSPLQKHRMSAMPGGPMPPMPDVPFMHHSNASGPVLTTEGGALPGSIRESVYDGSPLQQATTATFDDILGGSKEDGAAGGKGGKVLKKKRSFFF